MSTWLHQNFIKKNLRNHVQQHHIINYILSRHNKEYEEYEKIKNKSQSPTYLADHLFGIENVLCSDLRKELAAINPETLLILCHKANKQTNFLIIIL